MHIAVCIKQVPDSDQLTMDPETGRLNRTGAAGIINPDDENALEMALQLKDRHGARVTVLTMGPPAAEAVLKSALNRGADKGMLLTDPAFGGSDTWATARVLSRAVEKLEPIDLLLFGRQSTDGDTGQVGPGVAGFLDWPVLTDAISMEPAEAGFHVVRSAEEGNEAWMVDAPCALTVLKEANTPRRPLFEPVAKDVTIWGAAELGLAASEVGLTGSPTRVRNLVAPTAKPDSVLFEGEPAAMVAELVEALDGRNLL